MHTHESETISTGRAGAQGFVGVSSGWLRPGRVQIQCKRTAVWSRERRQASASRSPRLEVQLFVADRRGKRREVEGGEESVSLTPRKQGSKNMNAAAGEDSPSCSSAACRRSGGRTPCSGSAPWAGSRLSSSRLSIAKGKRGGRVSSDQARASHDSGHASRSCFSARSCTVREERNAASKRRTHLRRCTSASAAAVLRSPSSRAPRRHSRPSCCPLRRMRCSSLLLSATASSSFPRQRLCSCCFYCCWLLDPLCSMPSPSWMRGWSGVGAGEILRCRSEDSCFAPVVSFSTAIGR